MIKTLLLRFLESYFRHRWLYLVPFLLILGVAVFYFTTVEPKYVSRGNLYIQNETLLSSLNSVRTANLSWWVTPAQNATNQINELLRTDAFVRAVISKTDLEQQMASDYATVQELIDDTRASIRIMPLGDSQIQISAAHETPDIALQTTNAVIESYIQWQVNSQRSQSEAAKTFFGTQITLYREELETARQNTISFLQANPEPLQGKRSEIEQMELDRLVKDMDLAEKRYVSALEKEENARLSLAQIDSDTRQSYVTIDAPRLPEEPEVSRRELAIQAAVFLFSAIVLTIAIISGDMLLDRTFRFSIDIQQTVSLPVLATVKDMRVVEKWYKRLFRRKKKIKEEPEVPLEQEALAASTPVEAQMSADTLDIANQDAKPEAQEVKPKRKAKRAKARALVQENKADSAEPSSEQENNENVETEVPDLEPVAINRPGKSIHTKVTI